MIANSKLCATVIVIATLVQTVRLISNEKNDTAAILFNLANFAIEGRQNRYPYPLNYQYQNLQIEPNKYSPYYQKQQGQYGLLQNAQQYPPNYGYYPQQNPKPYPQRPYYPPQSPYRPPQQSIMDVLYSISMNDRLRCVPRLLCELTSDTISKGRQFSLPSLPINLNMESVIGILSTIDAASGSPITSFAKAALLGYISKGNTDSCFSSYPQCPRDADKLVLYLNNYNGGFFRFFNGINPLGNRQYGLLNYPQNYPQKYPYSSNIISDNLIAQQRIQNKPVEYIPNNYLNGNSEGFIFPTDNEVINGQYQGFNYDRSPKTLKFPRENYEHQQGSYDPFVFRKPKELPFSINHYHSNELDLQRPLPNHKATPMIFPDRTGTGDLRLDPEELSENNNHFIAFNNPSVNSEGFYYRPYRPDEGLTYNYANDNKAIFSFPQI